MCRFNLLIRIFCIGKQKVTASINWKNVFRFHNRQFNAIAFRCYFCSPTIRWAFFYRHNKAKIVHKISSNKKRTMKNENVFWFETISEFIGRNSSEVDRRWTKIWIAIKCSLSAEEFLTFLLYFSLQHKIMIFIVSNRWKMVFISRRLNTENYATIYKIVNHRYVIYSYFVHRCESNLIFIHRRRDAAVVEWIFFCFLFDS